MQSAYLCSRRHSVKPSPVRPRTPIFGIPIFYTAPTLSRKSPSSAEQLPAPSYPTDPPAAFAPRRPTWRPALTSWMALGLLGVSAIAVLLWLQGGLTAWTPGIAISALGLASSITVVPGIMRRQSNARARPRLERVFTDTHNALQFLAGHVVIDSAGNSENQLPITSDLTDTLHRLLWAYMHCAYQIPSTKESPARFVITARQFARQLERTSDRDRDILEPRLTRAMDDFCHKIESADRDYARSPNPLIPDPAGMATFTVLHAARDFAWVFREYTPYPLELDEGTIELALSIERSRKE